MNQYPPIKVYRESIIKIVKQLLWDIKPRCHSARKHMSAIQGTHTGQKAMIVCNGPSLLSSDFSLLKDVYCFGLNKINLLFDKTDWRPNSIVSVNKFVLEQNADFFNETQTQLYLSNVRSKLIKNRKNVCLMNTKAGPGRFAKNCCGQLSEGSTVTYVAMQLAFHMGFSQVGLIGCDHNFAAKGRANKEVQADSEDLSHFDPTYFSGGVTWQLPDLVQSELHYQIAAEAFSEADRLLINCTEGGKLELLPRLSLKDFVALQP